MAAWVAGVDGCKAGWVVVLRDSARNAFAARLVPDFAALWRGHVLVVRFPRLGDLPVALIKKVDAPTASLLTSP